MLTRMPLDRMRVTGCCLFTSLHIRVWRWSAMCSREHFKMSIYYSCVMCNSIVSHCFELFIPEPDVICALSRSLRACSHPLALWLSKKKRGNNAALDVECCFEFTRGRGGSRKCSHMFTRGWAVVQKRRVNITYFLDAPWSYLPTHALVGMRERTAGTHAFTYKLFACDTFIAKLSTVQKART